MSDGGAAEQVRIERVRAALALLGHEAEIRVAPESTHTAAQAAAFAGCQLGQIVKTLVVYAGAGPVLALVAGDRRLDDRLLAARSGIGRKQVKLADAAQVLALTGYPVGGVSPFGLPAPSGAPPLPVLLDASFARFDTVWIAAGSASAICPIVTSDLVRYVQGEYAEITS
jgi:Cys-tRNA(Pro) deacylase